MPGFTITGELSSSAAASTWAAVRSHDDHALVLKIVRVLDMTEAQAMTTALIAAMQQIESEHLVRLHDAIALPGRTLALVVDEVSGGTLARALVARGRLTPGETVTTVAPLFGALADLHEVGVVHGNLAPRKILFSEDGRPMIADVGVAGLPGRRPDPGDATSGFVAPELVGGAVPSPASDVYALAAIGWLCLTGALPAAGGARASSATVSLGAPARLVGVLASCLSTDPAARPSALAAAVEVFDAATAESVHLGSVADPAGDITRRIRDAAVAVPAAVPPRRRLLRRRSVVIAAGGLLVASAFGLGGTWFLRLRAVAVQPTAVQATAVQPTAVNPVGVRPLALPSRTSSPTRTPHVTQAKAPHGVTDVVSSPDSPRLDATGLLQALVDVRALAYVARTAALLDLVYAPSATRAAVDRSNIAAALKNGATYLGLAFVIRDAAFLDGTPDTARIRATIVTPAYETGQPDGRKVSHPQESVGPSVFTVSWAPDGWRILRLTQP